MSILYSVQLKLKSEQEALISPTQGYHAYALFLALMRDTSPSVAEALHNADGPKPFTISPLQGKFQRAGQRVKLSPDDIYWIRLTFLKEDVFAYFMDSTLKTASKPLSLDPATFRIDEVVTAIGNSPLCQHQTYNNLLEMASPERQISLQFLSPTAFRSKGKRNTLFPEPRLVFGSYFAKWQEFTPCKMSDSVLPCLDKMIVTRYKLNTRILHFGSYQEVGFEGNCTFELAEDIPESVVSAINALADFAFYAGTGAKTTMGMGQTRRLR